MTSGKSKCILQRLLIKYNLPLEKFKRTEYSFLKEDSSKYFTIHYNIAE